MLLNVLSNISNLFLLACSCYFESKTYSSGADRWQERKKSYATGGLQLSKFFLFSPQSLKEVD